MAAVIADRSSSGIRSRALTRAAIPSLAWTSAAARASAWSPNTRGKYARTAWPKMIGSDTFIIVALRCTEKRTPCSLASATCCARKASSAARRMTAASSTSPASTAKVGLEHGDLAVRGDVLDADLTGVRDAVTDRSVERKSPSLIVETCECESGDHVAHRVRVIAGIGLDRVRRPAVGVALAQDGVDGAALDAVVALADVALLVVGRARPGSRGSRSPAPGARRWRRAAGARTR